MSKLNAQQQLRLVPSAPMSERVHDDTVAVAETATDLEAELNAHEAAIKQVKGTAAWTTAPADDLAGLASRAGALEGKKFIDPTPAITSFSAAGRSDSVETQLSGQTAVTSAGSTVGTLADSPKNRADVRTSADGKHIDSANNNPVFGRLSDKFVSAQPVNVTGVELVQASTDATNATLAYTNTGQTLAWGDGSAVAVEAGGTFTLTSTSNGTLIVEVTPGSLPGTDQNDALTITSQWTIGYFELDGGSEKSVDLAAATVDIQYAKRVAFPDVSESAFSQDTLQALGVADVQEENNLGQLANDLYTTPSLDGDGAANLATPLETQASNHRTFTGASSATDTAPTYASTNIVTQGEPLETAVGDLDQAWGNLVNHENLTSQVDDGDPLIFTTANNFVDGSERLLVNGVEQFKGAGNDYTVTGANQITFAAASQPTGADKVWVHYRKPIT